MVNAAESPELKCYVDSGEFNGQIEWKKVSSGKVLEDGKDGFKIEKDVQPSRVISTLKKTKITSSDADEYICYVGTSEGSFTIRVIGTSLTTGLSIRYRSVTFHNLQFGIV